MTYTRTYTVNERALHAMENQTRVKINTTGVEGVILEMYATAEDTRKLRVVVRADDGTLHHANLNFGVLQFQ